MAIPKLYWMLECNACGSRRVVYDQWLDFVGNCDADPRPGDGFGGTPLPDRYHCANGCTRGMRALGSIHEPGDRTMWLSEPHIPIELDQTEVDDWSRLIREADLQD